MFRDLTIALQPILPKTTSNALRFLGLDQSPLDFNKIGDFPQFQSIEINAYTALFTRIDPKQIETMIESGKRPNAADAATITAPAAPTKHEFVGIDDFAKLDLRIGKVLECGFIDGSDKLLRFLLDAGELGQRQIFSGIRASYGEPEKLVGRNVVFIANLAPRKMRFGTSEGMILSAGFDGGALSLLDVDAGAQPGMPVK